MSVVGNLKTLSWAQQQQGCPSYAPLLWPTSDLWSWIRHFLDLIYLHFFKRVSHFATSWLFRSFMHQGGLRCRMGGDAAVQTHWGSLKTSCWLQAACCCSALPSEPTGPDHISVKLEITGWPRPTVHTIPFPFVFFFLPSIQKCITECCCSDGVLTVIASSGSDESDLKFTSHNTLFLFIETYCLRSRRCEGEIPLTVTNDTQTGKRASRGKGHEVGFEQVMLAQLTHTETDDSWNCWVQEGNRERTIQQDQQLS